MMDGAAESGLYFEDLVTGMEASLAHTVAEEDLRAFARIAGDANPIHLDENFAATTPFKRRIAHGMLGGSCISAVFGTRLPGPGCIYVSQTLSFKAPVLIGDEVISTVRITDLIEPLKRAIFTCTSTVRGTVVVEGEAVLMVPSRSAV
jgi:3-hydroxybutyryl-CoA dehydratase